VEVPVRVEVPMEVPVEYPVYIEKPVVDEEYLISFRKMENDLQTTLRENAMLAGDNDELRKRVAQLAENLEMLRRHNEEKNREVEILLQNSIDYLPFSPNQDYSVGSVKYSISSNPHPRVI
jgi:predicted RNase H-like nuclease (RuvC/YqgF family)